VRFQFIVYLVA